MKRALRTGLSAFFAAALLVAGATPSDAVVKQYFSQNEARNMCEMTTLIASCAFTDPERFHGSFLVLRNPQGVISVQPSPMMSRLYALDEVTGNITLHHMQLSSGITNVTTNAEGTFGPGGILFIRAKSTTFPGTPQGPFTGSTSSGGTIDWGLVTGFDGTGDQYCASGNGTLCAVIARVEDMSVSAVVPSATYDLGTWTFDASGHFTSPPFIRGTLLGGTANNTFILNGGLINNELPALPLLGLGALAVGLLVAGGRAALRTRRA